MLFEFIETPFFTKVVSRYLSDDEYAELRTFLNQRPDAGALVPG